MGISVFPATGGTVPRTIDFTTSGTWVAPAGVYSAEVLVVGAGGGAGGVYCALVTNAVGSAGAGGGAVKKATIPITPGSTYTITVGAKGTGGTNTAGTNGGFSEIVLSGSTLIKSYGGRGSWGINTTPAVVLPAIASGSSYGAGTTASATDATACTGGGGGAIYSMQGGLSDAIFSTSATNAAVEGSFGKLASTSEAAKNIVGVMGIDGFGSGGNGANWDNAAAVQTFDPPYGAGTGAVISNATGAANGGNALANTGGGGGGACVVLTAATGSTGGNGSDGLVRITYNG
jgi:hypothetical protein